MHMPPAVSYEVVRSRWHFFIVCFVGSLAALVVAAYGIQQPESARLAALVGISSMCLFFALVGWFKSPVGVLRWDGATWVWSGFGDVPVKSLELRLDLQFAMWLELTAESGKTVWFLLEARHDRLQWLRLRRAVVAQGQAQSHGLAALKSPSDLYI